MSNSRMPERHTQHIGPIDLAEGESALVLGADGSPTRLYVAPANADGDLNAGGAHTFMLSMLFSPHPSYRMLRNMLVETTNELVLESKQGRH